MIFINSILEVFHINYIRPEDTRLIPLYMDQVTRFMDAQLAASNGMSDKILTKTMINNYTKNNLLPPPDKKKVFHGTHSAADLYLLFQEYSYQ